MTPPVKAILCSRYETPEFISGLLYKRDLWQNWSATFRGGPLSKSDSIEWLYKHWEDTKAGRGLNWTPDYRMAWLLDEPDYAVWSTCYPIMWHSTTGGNSVSGWKLAPGYGYAPHSRRLAVVYPLIVETELTDSDSG